MRMVRRVLSLQKQTQDEVIYTYQRVFKFLIEFLTDKEFQEVNFQNVNKFIDVIQKLRDPSSNSEPTSLK